MKYGWNIEEIEGKLSNLPQKNDSTDYEKSARTVYEEMISDYYSIDVPSREVSKNEFIRAIKNFDIGIINDKYLSLAIYLGDALHTVSFDIPEVQTPNYGLDQIINLSKTYIRRNEKGGNYNFRKVIGDPRKIHIKFNQSIYNAWGKSYILNRNEFYVLIKGMNGIQDTVTFLHESGHIEDYFKYGGYLTSNYYELSSITREHYAFDFMKAYENEEDVNKVRAISLYHYFIRIIRLYQTIMLTLDLIKDDNYLEELLENYDKLSSRLDINEITSLLNNNFEEELSYIISFIASLDIYLNCLREEAPLFVSMYHAGIRDINVKIVDKIIPYLTEILFSNSKTKSI